MSDPDVTVLLQRWTRGDDQALEDLTPLVYRELRRLAAAKLTRERGSHTLQPTALIHEAFIKLVQYSPSGFNSRTHFYAVASQLMRQVLVDHARKHRTAKRGSGDEVFSLDEAMSKVAEKDSALVALDDALNELGKIDDRKRRLIEMKYFGGLTSEEIAEALGISVSTVTRDARLAEAWLNRYMSAPQPPE